MIFTTLLRLQTKELQVKEFHECETSRSHLLPVSGGLVQRLQPHVPQSQHGVGVILRRRLLQDALKLLLTGAPLLLGQVQVPDQGPGVWVVLHQNTSSWTSLRGGCGPSAYDLTSVPLVSLFTIYKRQWTVLMQHLIRPFRQSVALGKVP